MAVASKTEGKIVSTIMNVIIENRIIVTLE